MNPEFVGAGARDVQKKVGDNSPKIDEDGGTGLNRLSPKFHTSQTVTDQDSKNSKIKFDYAYLPTDENNEQTAEFGHDKKMSPKSASGKR